MRYHDILVPTDGTNEMSLESRADLTLASVLDLESRSFLLEAIEAIEFVEARQVFELAIVRLAAERRTETDLDLLRGLCAGMGRCRNEPVAFAGFDFVFHVALADAAHNTVLANSLATLHEGMREMIAGFALIAVSENRIDALVESHVRLVEAIGRRDADDAEMLVSDMMILLRIDSGRCRTRKTLDATKHQLPQVGMLQNASQR